MDNKKEKIKKYVIGDRKNNWTIIGIIRENKRKLFIVKCECGKEKKTWKAFESKSCGCIRKLGQTSRSDPNRLSWYHRWKAMMRRCHVKTDKQYYNYGARGIKVCNRWLIPNGVGSENYYNDVHDRLGPQPSPEHSLDRIDNNGMYEISNLRWATNLEQTRNRRSSLKDTNYKLDL